MSRYDVKDEYDVESQRDIKLTSYNVADNNDELGRFRGGNNNGSVPTELNGRLDSVSRNDDTVASTPEKELTGTSCGRWMDRRLKGMFRRKLLYKRIPIIEWLPKYRREYIVSDIVAGVTVGLTVIPQAIAYANVAGLPLQYGLYSSFMSCFIYTIFGSCKDVPVGPTAIAAIMTHEALEKANLPPIYAVTLAFVSGLVSLLMGVLQLGFLIDFISGPVSVGFTSAAAIIIATSQVKDILGLKISGGKFLQVWKTIFENYNNIRIWDSVLGVVCIIVLLLLRKVKDILVVSKDEKMPPLWRRTLEKFFWLITTSRNILVVMVCAIAAWMLEDRLGDSPVILTGHVEQGLPAFQLPPLEATIGNKTYDFFDTISLMGSGCIIVPLLSILETIAIAKAFPDGKPIDATQEMLSIGLCNILSSFVGSIPVSGGLSRGAVNHSSGVRTTFGGVYTGILVLVSLQFLTPYLYFIPKASLGAVIIAAVVFMVEIQVVKPMWRTKKIDLVPAVVTFLSCLFIQLEVGILIGIGVNLVYLLYGSARPSLRVSKATSPDGVDYLVITPDRSLVFPSVEYVRSMISKHGSKQGNDVPIVIDSTHIQGADFTAAKGIKSLLEDFARRGQPLIFYNLKPSVFTIFQGVKPVELKSCYNENELNEYLKEIEVNSTQVTRH